MTNNKSLLRVDNKILNEAKALVKEFEKEGYKLTMEGAYQRVILRRHGTKINKPEGGAWKI